MEARAGSNQNHISLERLLEIAMDDQAESIPPEFEHVQRCVSCWKDFTGLVYEYQNSKFSSG
jgi:hypothetical protein